MGIKYMYNSGNTPGARSYIYFIGCLEKIEDFNTRASGEKSREIYGGRVWVKLNFMKIIKEEEKEE